MIHVNRWFSVFPTNGKYREASRVFYGLVPWVPHKTIVSGPLAARFCDILVMDWCRRISRTHLPCVELKYSLVFIKIHCVGSSRLVQCPKGRGWYVRSWYLGFWRGIRPQLCRLVSVTELCLIEIYITECSQRSEHGLNLQALIFFLPKGSKASGKIIMFLLFAVGLPLDALKQATNLKV